jgi:hypothetical protein
VKLRTAARDHEQLSVYADVVGVPETAELTEVGIGLMATRHGQAVFVVPSRGEVGQGDEAYVRRYLETGLKGDEGD